MKTVELTELVPYMDERELTDEVLEELGFTKVDMTIEETGEDEDFYIYELNLLFPYVTQILDCFSHSLRSRAYSYTLPISAHHYKKHHYPLV